MSSPASHVWTAIKRANRPGPPESSLILRGATAGALATSIAACFAEGELGRLTALSTAALMATGMVFSYRTRMRPLGWVKPLLGAAVVLAFVWFFHDVTHVTTGSAVGSVDAPLAVLFAWVQVTHSFDVPSRRDLAFSLAGSVSLMAVAAVQAVDLSFGLYVVTWAAFCIVGLGAMWSSMSGGGSPQWRGLAWSGGATALIALLALAVLPAPQPSTSVVFPSSLAGDLPVSDPGGLAGGGPHGVEPAKASPAGGRTGVGGFLGFAGPLNTAIRAPLGNEVVMRVRAQRPSYWLGETYRYWNGQSWSDPHQTTRTLRGGSPFAIPLPTNEVPGGEPDLQTFYLAVGGPNLVFHAPNAAAVWFPERKLYVTPDGSIRTGVGMGTGTVYTVMSEVQRPTPAELRASSGGDQVLPPPEAKAYLELPHPYRRVAALAKQVTESHVTTYGKVEALIGWIGAHTRYSTDIPPLAPGQDAVDAFLFGTRVGYCEQISTSLAVMLRSLGIPAREATGYVPGPYNPITDLYEIQAKDAHAWVQVWFPGYGWQSFDPTAVVPLANPSPGRALAHDALAALGRVPLLPTGAAAALLALAIGLVVWRQRRPRTWAERVARQIERAGARSGRSREPSESLSEYARMLDVTSPVDRDRLVAVAKRAEATAYGSAPAPTGGRRHQRAHLPKIARTARGRRHRKSHLD